MNLMRYTIIEHAGGVSFVGDCRLLDALVAACAAMPHTLADLLAQAEAFDLRVRDYVLNGLAVFDEHNVPGAYDPIHRVLAETRPVNQPAFRIVDDLTRVASLQPVRTGLVIFNLINCRIVQVQNTYQEVMRSGRVQMHNGRTWLRQTRPYELPYIWSIVP